MHKHKKMSFTLAQTRAAFAQMRELHEEGKLSVVTILPSVGMSVQEFAYRVAMAQHERRVRKHKKDSAVYYYYYSYSPRKAMPTGNRGMPASVSSWYRTVSIWPTRSPAAANAVARSSRVPRGRTVKLCCASVWQIHSTHPVSPPSPSVKPTTLNSPSWKCLCFCRSALRTPVRYFPALLRRMMPSYPSCTNCACANCTSAAEDTVVAGSSRTAPTPPKVRQRYSYRALYGSSGSSTSYTHRKTAEGSHCARFTSPTSASTAARMCAKVGNGFPFRLYSPRPDTAR